ncbi:MAG: TolC family protein [Bacteroidia bacterium]|nr:TolC family protein [Bacteroidia bacterium]
MIGGLRLYLLFIYSLSYGQSFSLPSFPPPNIRWISLSEFLQNVYKNALTTRQAALSLYPTRWEVYQAHANFLPNISANASLTQNYGTTFDPFAFSRVQQTTTFSSGSIGANLVLFGGFANHYLLRQARANAALMQASYRRTQAEVLAQALLQLSQTLADSVAIVLSQQRIQRLQDQLQRISIQIRAGQSLSIDSLSIAAQIAREEAQYLTLYNRHRENKLTLLQLMGWEDISPDSVEFRLGIEVPELGPLSDKEAIQQALANAPELEESRWREIIQKYSLKLSRAAYWPTISLSASIQTNYSSNAGNIRFDPTRGIITEPLPFEQQVRENINQSIFISFSFPIFQQLRRRLQVARAETNLSVSQLQALQQRQQVIRRTQQAYLAWQNALAQEKALQRSAEAAERAFRQMQAQYEVGRITYWSFRDALQTYTQAEAELAQARLERAMRTILLSAYLGKYSNL